MLGATVWLRAIVLHFLARPTSFDIPSVRVRKQGDRGTQKGRESTLPRPGRCLSASENLRRGAETGSDTECSAKSWTTNGLLQGWVFNETPSQTPTFNVFHSLSSVAPHSGGRCHNNWERAEVGANPTSLTFRLYESQQRHRRQSASVLFLSVTRSPNGRCDE